MKETGLQEELKERSDDRLRDKQRGEADEPDAPESVEESESMGTILNSTSVLGVQTSSDNDE